MIIRECRCTVPPVGWYCTREVGHEGPCAAWPADAKDEQAEQHYTRGSRQAWMFMLGECLHHLGYADPIEARRAEWIIEREATLGELRQLCDEFGDNDWDNHLCLADVLRKHLGNYLWDRFADEDS